MIRKITSRQDEERKRRRNQIILGGILIFLMLVSVLGYSFETNQTTNTDTSPKASNITYNGFTFAFLNGLWSTSTNQGEFTFINSPEQSYKVTQDLRPLSSYSGKALYLYSENYDAEAEISRNFYGIANIRYACPENETKCDKNLPVKTCLDNFIIIREKNETSISQKDGCVFINGNAGDLTRLTDGFLLKIIGIQ